MPNSVELVHSYFDREASGFAAIYDKRKPIHRRIIDALFRRVVVERFALVTNAITASGRTICDVGCGPGHYGVELARRGASWCEGIDVSAQMIELARSRAVRAGVADRCTWKASEFLALSIDTRFDIMLAMGYFDYVAEPLPHLRKMLLSAREQLFASFPKRWTLRTLSRLIRFKVERGYVRFYSRKDVLKLFRAAGCDSCLSVIDFGRDYLVVCNLGASRYQG